MLNNFMADLNNKLSYTIQQNDQKLSLVRDVLPDTTRPKIEHGLE